MQSKTTMERNYRFEVGDKVSFESRWAGKVQGVLVKATRYAWCAGANSYEVYSPETGCVHSMASLDMTMVEPWTTAEARERNLFEARAHYTKVLAVYPAWQARFASGATVGW